MKPNLTYRKNRLYKAAARALLLIALPVLLQAAQRDDLYDLGRKAFKKGDYVDALKNLSAYYAVNEAEIKAKPEFNESMLDKIQKCEAILRLALAKSSPVRFGVDGSVTMEMDIPYDKGIVGGGIQGVGGGIRGSGMEVNDMLCSGKLGLKK